MAFGAEAFLLIGGFRFIADGGEKKKIVGTAFDFSFRVPSTRVFFPHIRSEVNLNKSKLYWY